MTTTSAPVTTTTPSSTARTAGRVISGLVVAFLAFDAVTHLLNLEAVREASERLGQPDYMAYVEGAVMTVCLIVHLVPRTAVIGAVLLTGYLGGAIAVNLASEQPVFNSIFAFAVAALVWLGLWLRDPRVRATYAA